MPRKALNIGTGLAAGVQGFLNSYMQVSQMKQQQKQQENAFLIQILTRQLEDENLPAFQKVKILDSIPPLAGIKKMDRRLSEMLGYDEYVLNQPAEIEKGKPGTPEQTLVDENVTDPAMASSVTLKGTQATSDVPSLQRKGDLTPALIKKKLILEAKKAEDEQDIDKQAKLLKINYDLQKESLKGEGFSKEIFRGYDNNGNYIVTLVNPKGEKKDIFLGDVDSEAITKAGITANKPSIFVRDREKFWLTQTNPATGQNYSEQEASIKALEDANKQFKLKLETGEAYKASVTQGITGTKPIQPAQQTDDTRQLAERRATLKANINTAKRQAADASLDARQKTMQASNQWINVVEPIKREMQKLLDEGLETTEPEYTRQQARLNTEIDRYNELKRQADDAVSRDNSFKNSAKEAEDILNQFESEIGGPKSNLNTNLKKAIDLIRQKNPTINDPNSATYMSDEAIVEYLKRKGKLK